MDGQLTILLVDDSAKFRSALKRNLDLQGYKVVDFGSGGEAVSYLSQAAESVSYAFVDQVLQKGTRTKNERKLLDGIETAEQLLTLDPNISVVLFSGQAEISPTEKQRARKAGVRRYVYKQGGTGISKLIGELKALSSLRKAAEETRHQREQIATTLRSIPIGTLLIDREWFPWVVSPDWRKIEGETDPLECPDYLLAGSLREDSFRKELIDSAFQGQEKDGLALCKVHSEQLKYLHTWARPVYDDRGAIIACSLSVVDETDSETVRNRSLSGRLQLVAEALRRAGYDRARLYKAVDGKNGVAGVVEVGGGLNIPKFEGYFVDFSDRPHFQNVIKAMQPRFCQPGEVDNDVEEDVGKTSAFIHYPLSANGLVGWLAVDREFTHQEYPMTEGDIEIIRPYAEEAQKVFTEASWEREHQEQFHGVSLSSVWAQLNRCTNPKEAMQVLVAAVRSLTECEAAMIHVRQGEEVKKVAMEGELPQFLPSSLPWRSRYWIPRTIKNQQPSVVQDMQKLRRVFLEETESWPPKAREILRQVQSFAIFPTIAGETFGALTVISFSPDHFTLERRQILQELARIAATAWIDFTRQQSAQEEERSAMALATVHNLRQPTMAIRGALQRILKRKAKGSLTVDYAIEATQDALRYLERSEHIISNVLRYVKPLTVRAQTVHLRPFVQIIVEEFMAAHNKVKVAISIPQEIMLHADLESLRQVFEELFGNAAQAMQNQGTIQVLVQDEFFHDQRETSVLKIIVEDDGPGVPQKFVDQLFQPFRTGSAKGTGLGLAFIKRVMEEHKGQVWHERVNPHGARFVLALPASPEENSDEK